MKKNIVLLALGLCLGLSQVSFAQSGDHPSSTQSELLSSQDFKKERNAFEKATNADQEEASISNLQTLMRKAIESSKVAIAEAGADSKEANALMAVHMKRANLYNELIVALRNEKRGKQEILSILDKYAATF